LNLKKDPKDCPLCQQYLQGPCGSLFQQWLDCATQERHADTYVTACAAEFARFVACHETQTAKGEEEEGGRVEPNETQSLQTEQQQRSANDDDNIVADKVDKDDAKHPSMETIQKEWQRLIREELAHLERRPFAPVEERFLHDTSPFPPYLWSSSWLPSSIQFRFHDKPPLSQSPSEKERERYDRPLFVVFPSSHNLVLVYCIATTAATTTTSTNDPTGILVAAGGKGDLISFHKANDHRLQQQEDSSEEEGVSHQIDAESLALYIPSLPHDCQELVVSAVYEQCDDDDDDDDDDASDSSIVYEHVFSRPFS